MARSQQYFGYQFQRLKKVFIPQKSLGDELPTAINPPVVDIYMIIDHLMGNRDKYLKSGDISVTVPLEVLYHGQLLPYYP